MIEDGWIDFVLVFSLKIIVINLYLELIEAACGMQILCTRCTKHIALLTTVKLMWVETNQQTPAGYLNRTVQESLVMLAPLRPHANVMMCYAILTALIDGNLSHITNKIILIEAFYEP